MDAVRLQISGYLGTGPDALNVDFKDTGDAGRLQFDKNKLLGSGSYGTRVFLGIFRQQVTNELKLVAIKHVNYNSDEDFRKTYREVENLQQLTHPNVVQYLFADKVDAYNIMLIALELCRGSLIDLFSHQRDVFKKPFVLKNREYCDSWWFKKSLLYGVADGLKYVHGQRYVHMDLKPQNILVRDDNSNLYRYKAVLCDFELTRKMKDGKSKLSLSQEAVGTHGWMAREVLTGSKRVSQFIDVFAFGCIVHYVLSEDRTEQFIHPFGSDRQRDNLIARAKRCSYISFTLQRLPGRQEIEPDSPLNYGYLGDAILADMLVDVCVSDTISLRPKASEILEHPFFWSYGEKIRCTQQMFDTFKDQFEIDDVIPFMEETWDGLNVMNIPYLIPEVWWYLIEYSRIKRRPPSIFTAPGNSTLFNGLMRLICDLQQHYQEVLSIYPNLKNYLSSGDDETLGQYFFERIPLS